MARWVLGLLRWALPLFLLAIIGRRLTQLGWHDIWIARPSNPGFYVLLAAQFFIQPWGDYYGKLTDRFGVQWMLNCTD